MEWSLLSYEVEAVMQCLKLCVLFVTTIFVSGRPIFAKVVQKPARTSESSSVLVLSELGSVRFRDLSPALEMKFGRGRLPYKIWNRFYGDQDVLLRSQLTFEDVLIGSRKDLLAAQKTPAIICALTLSYLLTLGGGMPEGRPPSNVNNESVGWGQSMRRPRGIERSCGNKISFLQHYKDAGPYGGVSPSDNEYKNMWFQHAEANTVLF